MPLDPAPRRKKPFAGASSVAQKPEEVPSRIEPLDHIEAVEVAGEGQGDEDAHFSATRKSFPSIE